MVGFGYVVCRFTCFVQNDSQYYEPSGRISVKLKDHSKDVV